MCLVPRAWSYLDTPRPFCLAHRGAHGAGVPENSMAAFEAAVRLGVHYVETDVHATADGVLVAVHDRTLDRVTDRTGRISELPFDEVARARLSDGSAIPLLTDLLGTWPDLRVNIDAKEDSAVGPLLDVLRQTGAYHRVCVGAFSTRRIRLLRQALPPGTATALGPTEVAALRLGRLAARWLPAEVPCVQVPVRTGVIPVVDQTFVARAHEQGRQVHVWTINDEDEMRRLLELRVDGLVTDNVAGLQRLLGSASRGESA
jgi:glycerophosphoryl diester phosphodiesterase